MRFNINHKVKVRLSDRGLAILESQHWDLQRHLSKPRPFEPPKTDADGWSSWQLWDLMGTFGEHITLGVELPFEIEIEMPGIDLTEAKIEGARLYKDEVLKSVKAPFVPHLEGVFAVVDSRLRRGRSDEPSE